MGKASRLKRERMQAIARGEIQPVNDDERNSVARVQQRESEKSQKNEIEKNAVLTVLKREWKYPVIQQYKKEPEKVRNTNIEKNTDDICNNFQVKMAMKMKGIKREDIKNILTQIRDEVIAEAGDPPVNPDLIVIDNQTGKTEEMKLNNENQKSKSCKY